MRVSELQDVVREAIWQNTRGTLAADRVKVTEHAADAAICAVIGYLDDKAAAERRGEGDFVPLVILEAWEIVANDLRSHLPASDTEAT